MPRKRTASIFSQLNTCCGGLHKSCYSKCITLLLDLSGAAAQAFSPHLALSRPGMATDHHALATATGCRNSISDTHHYSDKYIYINIYIFNPAE